MVVVDVLQGLTIREAIGRVQREFTTVPLGMPLSDIVRLITNTRQTCFPVMDMDGHYYGLFGLNDIRQFLYDSGQADCVDVAPLATAFYRTLEPAVLLPLRTGVFRPDDIVRHLVGRSHVDSPWIDRDYHRLIAVDPGDLLY